MARPVGGEDGWLSSGHSSPTSSTNQGSGVSKNLAESPSNEARSKKANVSDSLVKLQDHVARIKSLEAALYQEQQAYRSELKRQRTDLSVRERAASSKEQKDELKDERKSLQAMERARPTETPLLLWAALGSANLMLPDRERLRYKASYERFKVVLTITHLCLAILLIFVDHWTWLDAVSNFVLVYAYSTMTLRESILQLNGSSLHPWWIWHHYLCILLAGMLLIWPNTPVYRSMRTQLLYFMVYTAAVQVCFSSCLHLVSPCAGFCALADVLWS